MSIQIAAIFPDDIEKHFRNHLPREAVEILIKFALQHQDFERAMNEQMKIIQDMLKVTTMSTQQVMSMRKSIDNFSKKYDGSNLLDSELITKED